MAEACGLAGPATVRRVHALAHGIANAVAAAADEVRAMPAGAGQMLDLFATEIKARAQLVAANSLVLEGADEADDLPTTGVR